MNNKEYGVKLNADISNFTSKLNDAKNYTNEVMDEIKNKIKEPMEEVGEASKNSFTGRIQTIGELAGQMADLTLQYANAVSLEGKQSEKALELKDRIRGLNDEMSRQGQELEEVGNALSELFDEEEKATNGMSKFGSIIENVKNKGKGISVAFFRFGDDVSKSVTRGVNSLKRFSLSLLGIHSLYSMLSRATNAYMAQDETLHTKMQANWIALGAMLAPIIEKIVSLFQRLVAYVNVFWKAFTGKNLIDIALKKVQKTAKGTTKAVKELNKELANIDEITNLNFDQSGGNIDAGGIGDSAYDIEDALNEIKNLKLNPEVVKVIEWIAQKLKDAWNWCVKIKDKLEEWGISLNDIITLIGVVFGASQVGRIVSGIAQVIGVSGGTAGLYGMITALSIIDVYLGVKLYNKIKELGQVWDEHKTAEERLGDSRIKIMNTSYDRIQEINDLLAQGITTDEHGNDLQQEKTNLLEEAQNQYKEFNKEANSGVNYSKAQKAEMEEIKKKLEKISGTKWKAKQEIEVEMKQSKKNENFWDSLTEKMRKIYSDNQTFFKALPLITTPGDLIKIGSKGLGFAKGNVAYEPTYAQFGEYAGARSNPEITAPQNMMRETLFEALADALPLINNNGGGDTILYVNGKELARATYSDFQSEGSRLGSSNVAVRRR